MEKGENNNNEPKVIFIEDGHEYWVKGKKAISATTLLGKFHEPLDEGYWQTYGAYKKILGDEGIKQAKRDAGYGKFPHNMMPPNDFFDFCSAMTDPKDFFRCKKEVKQEWKDSQINGTAFHLEREEEMYEAGISVNPFDGKEYTVIKHEKEYDNQSLTENLLYLETGCYPELLVWWEFENFCVTGQIDVCYIEEVNNDKFVDLDDYKGLVINTPIATDIGWKEIVDIKIGDNIFDGKGKLTKVKNVSEIHYNPCYKITFDTNDEIICDHEHKWVISERRIEYKGTEKVGSVNVDIELTTEYLYKKFINERIKPRIECTKIHTEDADLSIDPYILGIWLADGNRTCGTLTCVNNDIWNEIEKRGYKTSDNHNKDNDKTESRTIYKIRGKLSKIGVLNNKHIPDSYLRASHKQRLDLLRGIMDGDGHLHKSRKRCVMNTTSIAQAEYTSSLISSLGFKPTTIPYKGSGFGKTDIQCYSVNFTPTENPFLCRNKDYTDVVGNNIGKYSKYRYIKRIEKVDTVPTKCLAVESEDHTYLAGFNFIKTHNTNKKLGSRESFWKYYEPFGHLSDSKLVKYNLQLSLYQYILELWGFKPRHQAITHYKNYDVSTGKKYQFQYMKDDVKKMLEIMDKQMKKN